MVRDPLHDNVWFKSAGDLSIFKVKYGRLWSYTHLPARVAGQRNRHRISPRSWKAYGLTEGPVFFLLWFDKRKKDCKSHPWKDHLQSPLKGTFMVIAGRISDKTKNTNKSESRSKKHKRRNPCSAPDDWNPNDPVQLKYDEMISKLILPIGYVFWGCYFRRLIIPGCQEILLRVQRLARKKDDGGYETHAIMCQEGIP